jgi:hypothetical protein
MLIWPEANWWFGSAKVRSMRSVVGRRGADLHIDRSCIAERSTRYAVYSRIQDAGSRDGISAPR